MEKAMELSDEQMSEAAGGTGQERTIIIKIKYSRYDGHIKIRQRLIEEMRKQNIPTDQVPGAFSLWNNGMEAGCKGGTLVYECDKTGRQIRCYKG